MANKRIIGRLLVLAFSFLAVSLSAQDAAVIEAGKTLFKANCKSCHNADMKSKMTGPALAGVEERWSAYPQADLYEWIRNSQGMIAKGHPRATELWNEYKPTVMNAFPNFTDEQIASLIAYINNPDIGAATTTVATNECAPLEQKENSNKMLYGFLFLVLAALAVILARIIANLNHMAAMKEKGEAPERKTLAEWLTSKGTVSFIIFAIIVVGGYFTVRNAINLGRQQGYQPEQPIAFSHVVHACEQKIDCNYCHDGARRSKQSVIPAANTCMNCHKAVKSGTRTGTAEITKIYASIGFDPKTDKYIENYDKLSNDEIKKIYTAFIGDTYVTNNDGKLDGEGEELIETQWNGIVKSLTNKKTGDDKIAGPIEWIRIHNLPDHVYFNHSQHVTVGKIACETCHGPVSTMETMKQYAPLSMGWCINCHRTTEVKFADNGYYDNYYEMYHNEMDSLRRSKVTVEDIGGTECQKCHY